jgi:hypothetical protein
MALLPVGIDFLGVTMIDRRPIPTLGGRYR